MSGLVPLIKSLDDPAIALAAAGLRPALDHNTPIGPLVRFASDYMTYKVDANGGGTHVYLYGTDEYGHSVMVRASGFYPYLYVELRNVDPRALINELVSTILHSLALDKKTYAPERKAAMRACVGTLRRRGGKTYHYAPKREAHMMPIVGYEIVPATIMRGFGGDYGYRGIEPRWMLKIYFYSPEMLKRGRSLLQGKYSGVGTLDDQARALATSKYSRDETIRAKETAAAEHAEVVRFAKRSKKADAKAVEVAAAAAASAKSITTSTSTRSTGSATTSTIASANEADRAADDVGEEKNDDDDEDDSGDAECAKAIYEALDDNANLEMEEFDAAREAHEAEASGVGSEWQNDDDADDDNDATAANELPEGVKQSQPGESHEQLERLLESEFVSTTRKFAKEMRGGDSSGILARLTEANPLKVCDADIEFVLRAAIDFGITSNAWIQVDMNAQRLAPPLYRDDVRNGKPHSADGQHTGFPNSLWMLDRAPPGIAPRETQVRRVFQWMGPVALSWSARAETYAQIELRCDFHHLSLVADAAMQETIAPRIRFSFDCEMQTGPGGAFPRAATEQVLNVGIAIPYPARLKSRKKWRTIVFAYRQMAQGVVRSDVDRHTLCFDDERLMLRAFFLFVSLVKPNEIITFNGHVFDMPYLAERSEVLGIKDDFLYCWSMCRRRSKVRITPRTFQSTAHGKHETNELASEGVIWYDIYQTVKRDPSIRLKSYSLDSLSERYLGDHKEQVSPGDINILQQTAEGRWRLGEYVEKDAMLPPRLDDKCKWQLGRIEKSRITGCTLHMLLERGMGIQGKALVYKWSRRGILIPAIAVEIGVPDAGKYRLCVNYTRTDYDRARESGTYTGAFVVDPKIGAYLMPVATGDFNSLYPSIQISDNLDCATEVAPDMDLTRDALCSHLVARGRYTWDTLVRRIPYAETTHPFREVHRPRDPRFLRHGVLRGLLPEIQRSNLSRRKEVRLSIKPLKKEWIALAADPLRAAEAMSIEARLDVLEQRQLSLKLVANSMYGLGGSDKSFQYSPGIASSVTQHGQVLMLRAIEIAERVLTMARDDPLVLRVEQFPGVKSLLLELPDGRKAVADMFDQVRRVRELAAARPLAMRQAGEASISSATAARTTHELTSFFGPPRRFRNSSDRVGSLVVDDSSREAAELDSDVRIRCVYGDTDSYFIRFWNGISLDDAARFCRALMPFVSICMHVYYGGDELGDCVFCIEFEKIADSFLIIAKKKYVMHKYTLEGDKLVADPKNPVMSGMEAGKRDTTAFVARGQTVSIAILLDKRNTLAVNLRRAVAYVYRELVQPLLENRVDLFELVMTKQLRNSISHYTALGKNPPIHVVLAALLTRRAGGPDKPDAPRPGDRLPFIIRRGDAKEPVSLRGESPIYAFQNGVPIDAPYYIEILAGVLMRIFQPLLTSHRTDLATDKERAEVTRLFLFGSLTEYRPPTYVNDYDFAEYREKSSFAPTIVRYPTRRRIAPSTSALTDLQPGALCIGCSTFMADRRNGAVCPDCMRSDVGRFLPLLTASMARLQIEARQLSVERAAIVYRCQKCMGNEKQYVEIKCQEWNCGVMWKRQANQQAMTENEARARDVSASRSLEW